MATSKNNKNNININNNNSSPTNNNNNLISSVLGTSNDKINVYDFPV